MLILIIHPSHPLSKIPSRSHHSECGNQELPVSLLTISFAVPSLAFPVFTSIGLFRWLSDPVRLTTESQTVYLGSDIECIRTLLLKLSFMDLQ